MVISLEALINVGTSVTLSKMNRSGDIIIGTRILTFGKIYCDVTLGIATCQMLIMLYINI